MDTDDRTRLARMFRRFAELEFHGSSPCYERLALHIAERPDLAAPLLAAPPEQRRATLYFAAVQYLLRTVAPGHPLRGYLPTLGGRLAPDDRLASAFTDFVTGFATELGAACATRTTQTNEALRSALLRPGFGLAGQLAGDRPLSLVELGTSAGLLLLPVSDQLPVRPSGHRAYQIAGVIVPSSIADVAVHSRRRYWWARP